MHRWGHARGAGQTVVELYARSKTSDVLLRRHPFHTYFVFTLHLVARVLKPVGDIAIVGQEEQPFGVAIEPTDVAEASVLAGKQVVDGAPAVRVLGSAQHPRGLVGDYESAALTN